VVKIEDLLTSGSIKLKDTYLLIDRIIKDNSDPTQDSRIADSVQSAFYEGNGEMAVMIGKNEQEKWFQFSNRFEEDGIVFEKPSVNLLSFNNPYGACKRCEGFGNIIGIDEDLVIPDKNLSIYEGAIAPWRGEVMGEWKDSFILATRNSDFPIHRSYYLLTDNEKDQLWNGIAGAKGINEFFKFLEEQSYKIQYRVMLSKYRGKTICPDCRGVRLRKDATYIKLTHTNQLDATFNFKDKFASISDILLMSVDHALLYFKSIELSEYDSQVAQRLMLEIVNRLEYLQNVGLGYLSLNRLSNSLSGGESQRINLATSLGSSLVGSTYILDEPSIGLHPRDTERLIGVLKNLRNLGNSVVVVEHDEDMMAASDQLIDIGPLAGTNGGHVVYQGKFENVIEGESLTGKYLSGAMKIPVPTHRRTWNHSIIIIGARYNNLKKVPFECDYLRYRCKW
jgi:excinuclease ABC subunit A